MTLVQTREQFRRGIELREANRHRLRVALETELLVRIDDPEKLKPMRKIQNIVYSAYNVDMSLHDVYAFCLHMAEKRSVDWPSFEGMEIEMIISELQIFIIDMTKGKEENWLLVRAEGRKGIPERYVMPSPDGPPF